MEILKKVDGLFITPVSAGADEQNRILAEELPFKVLEYKSGREHNGWTVPDKWEVLKAEIKKDGKLIYDGKQHPLGVIGLSESFQGRVSLAELKDHLFNVKDHPDDLIYHCTQYYQPYKKNWGFSMPYNLFQMLAEGEYEIDLQTTHTQGTMKVLEYTKKGNSEQTIILNAHNCHAAQLNDGPAGYAVGIEVMKRLQAINTLYTYKLVVAPEHLGTVFYLADLPEQQIKNYKACLFLEMLGNEYDQFAYQESFSGVAEIDDATYHYFKLGRFKFWSDRFRKIVGNDETVWEAPGIEVPTISLSRCQSSSVYYPEYHLSSDNLSIMSPARLEESVEAILGIIDIMEKNYYLKRKFTGLVALSNPKYDLYISTFDRAVNPNLPDRQLNWNYLMDCLPRYFNGRTTILEIADKHQLPFNEVYDYILKFQAKGLIEFTDTKEAK